MRGIIVTTLKSESETARKEAEAVAKDPTAFWFRTIRGTPKVSVGDRVYYVDGGMIRGYGIIFDVEKGEMWDDAHERSWSGTHLKQREWRWLKTPVLMKGFQGFRYADAKLLNLPERKGETKIE